MTVVLAFLCLLSPPPLLLVGQQPRPPLPVALLRLHSLQTRTAVPTVASPMRASRPRRTIASTRRLSRPVPRRTLSRRTNPSFPRRPVDQFERLRALTDRRHREGCLPDQFRRGRRRPGALLRLIPPSFGLEDAFCSPRRARGVRAWVWSLLTSLPRAVVPTGTVQPGSNDPSLRSTCRLPPNSTSSRILRHG